MQKQRNTNIEILRIISIILIVISHYCVHSGINYLDLNFGVSKLIIELGTLGNIGSILFIIISGYYLIDSKEFKISKAIKIEYQLLLYSLLIYIIMVILGRESFSWVDLIHNSLPLLYKKYWFASAYLIIYILHPFINKTLNNISRKEYVYLILILTVINSFVPTILNINYYGNELFDFVLFYALGGYLKKYPDNLIHRYNKLSLLISAIIIILSVILIDKFQVYFNILDIKPKHLLNRNSIVAILFSVSLFDVFINKRAIYNKFINKISSLVFGVYLFSDNQYIRKLLWIDIFKNANYIGNKYMILHLFVCVCLTVIVSLIVEFLRKLLFDDLIFNRLSKKVNLIYKNKCYKS